MRVVTVTQTTVFSGSSAIARKTERDGVSKVELIGPDGNWAEQPAGLVDAILTLHGAGPADVQPSAPEAEAPTVVAPPAE